MIDKYFNKVFDKKYFVFVYINDILILFFLYSFQKRVKHLELIFKELINHRLRVSKKKLKLFKTKIEF